jgi:octaprenyl-diphosphate synthase
MKLLGEKIGIAFQIRDYLFDFGDGDAGKPQGNVINSPDIAYTRQKMNEYRDDAIQLLRSFPPSVAREAMEDLILFVTERKK